MTRIEPPLTSTSADAAFAAGANVRVTQTTSTQTGGEAGRVPGRGMTHPVLRIVFGILAVFFGLIAALCLLALFAGGTLDFIFGVMFGGVGAFFCGLFATAKEWVAVEDGDSASIASYHLGIAINGANHIYGTHPTTPAFDD